MQASRDCSVAVKQVQNQNKIAQLTCNVIAV